ncbi:MAG: FapA family protein, partial [Acetatifactor sp.]|nr:FapA family protein [Acetatifactor sp.]
MRNGYFKLVKVAGGTGVRIIPPSEGGEPVQLAELMGYLDNLSIEYEINEIKSALAKNEEKICVISPVDCPAVRETYQLKISADGMVATARFYAPSETGERMNFNEFLNDLRFRNVLSGVQMQVLQDHFMSDGIFCTDLEVAKGKDAIPGEDDRIEYTFNTDLHIQPKLREDGTVDYFNLNTINHCIKGEVLARIIRGKKGEAGFNVMGKRLVPREDRRLHFRYGNNIEVSEDGLSLISKVDGHVVLVDDQVFVSDVYEVENVDLSTGNIDYTGSVQVNGNVSSNFIINAGGNVVVKGVVEGAHIKAGGNIVIARGMIGMTKGVLQAGGDVISKFIENATVMAEGYVNTESILHSKVSAGNKSTFSGNSD